MLLPSPCQQECVKGQEQKENGELGSSPQFPAADTEWKDRNARSRSGVALALYALLRYLGFPIETLDRVSSKGNNCVRF